MEYWNDGIMFKSNGKIKNWLIHYSFSFNSPCSLCLRGEKIRID
jgi:hypothetical protein